MSHSYPQDVDSALQEKAINLWQQGKCVAIPTETVYGLGADARNPSAVAGIYAVKSRPRFNPLIVHVADTATAQRYAEWNDRAETLSRFWPGPLTMVLRKRGDICDLVSAGGDTIGIRIPAHPLTRRLLHAFDGPIAAPSANRSGRISPTTAAHVLSEFGDSIPLIIDGGPCQVGLESTVVDLSGEHPVLLRPGAITRTMLEEALAEQGIASGANAGILKSPGQLESHYAPEKPLRLNAKTVEAGEGLLAFGPNAPAAEYCINLSERGDLAEAATRLFAALRSLDAMPVERLAAMPVPDEGIGEAINDRLQRAATR